MAQATQINLMWSIYRQYLTESIHLKTMCVKEKGRGDYWGIVSRFNKLIEHKGESRLFVFLRRIISVFSLGSLVGGLAS